MSSLFEVAQVVLAIAAFAYVFWVLVFSNNEDARSVAAERQRRGFERRAAERAERRIADLGPPTEGERRTLSRRGEDEKS